MSTKEEIKVMEDKGEKRKSTVREYIEAFLIALIIALFIRTFIIQAFKIPSGSMESTLLVGDHIFVSKFIYGFRVPFMNTRLLTFNKPEKGDVVVFIFPEDRNKDFIKRVVGVSGDVIEGKEKKVYVNGKPQEDIHAQYVDKGNYIPQRDDFGPISVPDGKIFVMGDNRDRSYDSRFWGFVDTSDVLGKAFIIYFSIEKDPGFHWYEIWNWPSHLTKVRWKRIGKTIH